MLPIPFSLANQFGRPAGAIPIQYNTADIQTRRLFLNDKRHQRNFIRRRGTERKSLKETSQQEERDNAEPVLLI